MYVNVRVIHYILLLLSITHIITLLQLIENCLALIATWNNPSHILWHLIAQTATDCVSLYKELANRLIQSSFNNGAIKQAYKYFLPVNVYIQLLPT